MIWLCLPTSKYFVFVRKAVNSLKCLTYCSIKDYELRRRNPVKYIHSSHGEYIDTKAVSPCQENTTALCWCAAKSRGTSPMACCQLSVSHIVLWLLISDRKSRPGQPCVRKYSRHCGCWQWRRRTEQSQVVQTCAKGQPGEQLNQKPDVANRACSQLFNPPQSLTMVPRGAIKKWNQSPLMQSISLLRISALLACVVPFLSQNYKQRFP